MLTPDPFSTANTGQLKERLRRLELYGPGKAHPSEAPRRDEATVLVIHAADMETIDASYVRAPVEWVALRTDCLDPTPSFCSAIAIFSELAKSYRARGVEIYFTHLRPIPRRLFIRAGACPALSVFFLGSNKSLTSSGLSCRPG